MTRYLVLVRGGLYASRSLCMHSTIAVCMQLAAARDACTAPASPAVFQEPCQALTYLALECPPFLQKSPRRPEHGQPWHLPRTADVPPLGGQLGGRAWRAARAARPPPGVELDPEHPGAGNRQQLQANDTNAGATGS